MAKIVPRRVLVVSGDAANSQRIADAIRAWTFETVTCTSLRESRNLLQKREFALIFCEDRIADGAYTDLLPISQDSDKTPVVVMTRDGSEDNAFREATHSGAWDVLPIPFSRNDVQWMVIHATRSKASRFETV